MAKIIFAFALLVLNVCFVLGHNYLSSPASRLNQQQSQTGCRYGGEGNPTCGGPCDATAGNGVEPPISIQRGASIPITWYRHTHPGGFIRFAWAPTGQSDDHATFDGYVDRYVCKEIGGCGPLDAADADSSTNGIDCSISLTAPTWLSDGAWTLQWAYFGGWLNAGDYYACVDYTVSGGPTGPQMTPQFFGGDYTYPSSEQCLFYSTNALRVCTVEPCTNGSYTVGVAQAGAAAVYSGGTGGTYTPVPIGSSTIVDGGSDSESLIPCSNTTDCPKGKVCSIDGFCHKGKSTGFGSGGVAAVVFACLVLVVILVAAIFLLINKKEIPFMKPFKGHVQS